MFNKGASPADASWRKTKQSGTVTSGDVMSGDGALDFGSSAASVETGSLLKDRVKGRAEHKQVEKAPLSGQKALWVR
jgi:hypothetical protein